MILAVDVCNDLDINNIRISNCNGHGNCSGTTCTCESGYTGNDCEEGEYI